jgi:hypothetical protein
MYRTLSIDPRSKAKRHYSKYFVKIESRMENMDRSTEDRERTLEVQRQEFADSPFLATPIAGLIVWLMIGIVGLTMPIFVTVWVLFIGTGSIVYLGLYLSKFTGENFLDKEKPKNEFDNLFLFTAGQAILVYSIAIPFFIVDYSSLPLTVGILTGLMWLPLSWIIKHWVGMFHAILRTGTILVLWYVFPEDRFVLIPFAIVLIYIITILILQKRST